MNVTASDGNLTEPPDSGSSLDVRVSRCIIALLLGITINFINGSMVHIFSKHDIFKTNPRYILFIHLVLNDMILLITTITLLIQAYVSDRLYVLVCVLFVIPGVVTTQNTPLNLLFMAVECYVSVCIPLRYNHICTVRRTYVVIGIIWAISFLSVLPDVVLMLVTEPHEFLLSSSKRCHWDSVFRSSYSRNKRDASHILFLVVVWFTLCYTYFRILFVAKAADANAKKARNTILIHGFQMLLCMIIYIQPMITQVMLVLFPGQRTLVYFTFFIISQVLPRFANPVVYGLRDATFRKYFKRYLSCTVKRQIHPRTVFKL